MSRVACVLAMLSVVSIAGCGGGSGPELYNVQGTVKFNGEPVPYGRIEFEPDTTKQNSGGPGYADIVDGRYDTSAIGGRGVVGGPHIVRITGMERKPDVDGSDEVAVAEAPPVPMLFQRWKTEKDFAKEDGATVDFEVPRDAIKTLAAPTAQPRGNEP